MTIILQWTALAVCLLCTAWRLPAMIKGRNVGLFWIFAVISLAVGLSMRSIYMPVDAFLGGINVANVILRLSLFAVFFLLAARVAAAYNSPLARNLVRGPVGIVVLVLCSLGIWISYFVSTKGPSSVGLSDLPDEPALAVYGWIGMAYMAYAAACVVIPTAKAAFSPRPVLDRASALLMSVGFSLVLLTIPIQLLPNPNYSLWAAASFSAVLCIAVGLALVWVSFLRRPVNATDRRGTVSGGATNGRGNVQR